MKLESFIECDVTELHEICLESESIDDLEVYAKILKEYLVGNVSDIKLLLELLPEDGAFMSLEEPDY